jgi:hypothetical protein
MQVVSWSALPLLVHSEVASFVTTAEWTVNNIAAHKQRGLDQLAVHWSQRFIWSSSAHNEVDLRLNLTMSELAKGTVRQLETAQLSKLCPTVPCPHCGGSGYVTRTVSLGSGPHAETSRFPCPACAGFGQLPSREACLSSSSSSSSSSTGWHWPDDLPVSLFVPANAQQSQVLLYRPFSSKIMTYSPPSPQFSPSTAEQPDDTTANDHANDINHNHDSNSSSNRDSNNTDGDGDRQRCGQFRAVVEHILFSPPFDAKDPARGLVDLVEQAAAFSVDPDHGLRLMVPITPAEAIYGFTRSLNIFRHPLAADSQHCEDLRVQRVDKPTLPGSEFEMPLTALHVQLCRQAEPVDSTANSGINGSADKSTNSSAESNNSNDVSNNHSGSDYNERVVKMDDEAMLFPTTSPHGQSFPSLPLRIQFQVLNATTFQQQFLNYWNCSIVEVIEVQAEEELVDLDGNEPPPITDFRPVTRREIQCPESVHESERVDMFQAIATTREIDKKYLHWLDFLTKT